MFLLVDSHARKSLVTLAPWITVAIVASPHLVRLVQHNFLPFTYAATQSYPRRNWYDHFLHPAEFALSQFVFLIPSFAILSPLIGSRQRKIDSIDDVVVSNNPWFDNFDRRIIAWLTVRPPH